MEQTLECACEELALAGAVEELALAGLSQRRPTCLSEMWPWVLSGGPD